MHPGGLLGASLICLTTVSPCLASEIGVPTPLPECRFVPAAARTLNLTGVHWATDLTLVHTGEMPASVSVAALARGADNRQAPVMVLEDELQPGQTRVLDDVVLDIVDLLWQDFLGALVVCSSEPGVEAFARTVLVREDAGGLGQGIPALAPEQGLIAGELGQLFPLREDEDVRTNVGLLNGTGDYQRVTLRLLDEAGETVIVIVHELKPYGQVQYTNFLRAFPTLDDRHARLEITTSGGPVFAYASMADNRTNDPTWIGMRVVPDE